MLFPRKELITQLVARNDNVSQDSDGVVPLAVRYCAPEVDTCILTTNVIDILKL